MWYVNHTFIIIAMKNEAIVLFMYIHKIPSSKGVVTQDLKQNTGKYGIKDLKKLWEKLILLLLTQEKKVS